MSDKNNLDSYIQPYHSTLKTLNKDMQGEFSKKLLVYLEQFPELSSSQSYLQCLCYCFDHYINYDPSSRDLSLYEKIKRASEMAINFLGIVTGPKA